MHAKDVKIVIYFDEAHVLTNPEEGHDPEEKTPYDILCGCLSNFAGGEVFFLFLSTSSHLNMAKLAPGRALSISARAADTAIVQAPITETPFDCHPDLPLWPQAHRVGDLSSIEFMSRFGRPLYVFRIPRKPREGI